MSAYSFLALAMLSSLRNAKAKRSDARRRDERYAYERHMSLFSGRGIVCMAAAPRNTQRKDPDY